MDCYAHVCLRDPSLYDKGVRIELEVPEIVAEKRPNWQILCNGEVMMSGMMYSKNWALLPQKKPISSVIKVWAK